MAVKYLRSAAAGTGTGANWTNAYTTLVLALAGVAAGDTIYVADDHAETQATAMVLTSPGTASNPVLIVCVNTHVTVPPTATATSATISTTGNSTITASGFAYLYGIALSATTGGTSVAVFSFGSGTTSIGWIFDTCKIITPNSGASTVITFGTTSASNKDQYVRLINTTFKFGAVGQQIKLGGIRLLWESTASGIDAGGSVPTILFLCAAAAQAPTVISGVDLSALGTGKSLVTVGTSGTDAPVVYFRNCKLGASVTVISGTIVGQGGVEVFLDNCDSGNTNYRMEHYKFQGSIVHETTIIKTAGASDGTTGISHKFVSLTAGPTLFSPLQGPWMTIWNDTTGSSKTLTVEFMHDSLTNLKNSDIYLEVEALTTSSFPLSVYFNSRVADIFATAADCAAGTGTGNWTTSGLTNPNSQKLTVSVTPAVKGPFRARVCLAKSNYTVYIDPLITVS